MKPDRIRLLSLLFALILLALPACGDSDDDAHDHNNDNHHNTTNNDDAQTHPLGTATTDGGHYSVTAEHDPATPATGQGTLTLTITADDAPVEGLDIAVTPWMPGHGHGSNATPEVSDDGDGVYTVTNVVYTMPGTWQAQIEIEGDPSDTIVFEYDVE